MPAFKIFIAVTLAVLSGALAAPSAVGGEVKAANSSTNRPPLVTELKKETVPGFPPVTRAIVSAGTNKFAFLVPRDFRVDASAPNKVILAGPEDVTYITVRVRPRLSQPVLAEKGKKFREACRQALLADHPGAKILSEFTRSADGHTGPAFDVQWMGANGALQSARAAFIPTPAGVLEFKLTAKPEKFQRATYKFNNVLLSFRTSQNGKLEYTPLSNKF